MRVAVMSCALVAVMLAAACAPFASVHEDMLGADSRATHVQSYVLPRTLIDATVDGQGRLGLKALKVGDHRHRYQIAYERSVTHHDDLNIQVSESGFLDIITANTNDKSAEIVKKISEIIVDAAKGPTLKALKDQSAVNALQAQLDPFEAEDFLYKNRMLYSEGYCIAVFDRNSQLLPGSCKRFANGHRIRFAALQDTDYEPAVLGEREAGFYYRRPVDHSVVVFRKDPSGRWTSLWAGIQQFEQQSELFEIEINRGAFINQQATLDFEAGIPTRFELNKPSELNGFMAIPATIVSTVIQLPGAQLTGNLNRLELRNQELALQRKELEHRRNVLAHRKAVDAFNADQGATAGNVITKTLNGSSANGNETAGAQKSASAANGTNQTLTAGTAGTGRLEDRQLCLRRCLSDDRNTPELCQTYCPRVPQ